jgi:ATP-independent RNA helicase DbpA
MTSSHSAPLQPAQASGFAALGLSPTLLQVVAELGFATPTPVQARAIPLLLAGRDLIGQSTTGSGKTAAFALAILQKLKREERHPQALILCPTRELCAQVARDFRKLGRREADLQVLILSGGQPMNPQLAALQKGVHVVVGTPGRALDHIKRGSLNLERVATIVVDEADRMLDMGFGEEMEKILSGAPVPRQTVFFSATYPRSIEAMSKAYQKNPQRLTVRDSEGPVTLLRQRAYDVEDTGRVETLLALLRASPPESAIVFCNFKKTVTRIEQALAAAGVSSATLHGDLEQKERDFVMAKLRNHSIRVLVATDVAARGLDIEGLDLVVNFELPFQPETYVHRIGRTGRAGKAGTAVALVGPQDGAKVKAIEAAIGSTLERQATPVAARTGADAPDARSPSHAGATMETLYISGGRKDKMRPGDILGALTGEAGGLPGSDVGKIEIHDRFSYVAIAKGSVDRAIEQLGAGRIKGKKFKVGRAK